MTIVKHKKSIAKYQQLCNRLKNDICTGIYSRGDKLPTCRELTITFDTSYMTVNNALRLLEDDGYIKRMHGKGIFVTEPKLKESRQESSTAGYLMDINITLFGRFFNAVLESSMKQPVYNVPLNSPADLINMSFSECEAWLDGVMHNHFDSLVLFGDRHFPFSALKRYTAEIKQLIFVMFNSSNLKFPNANSILVDAEKIGYMAASHFLSNGQRKLVVLSLRQLDEMYRRKLGISSHDYGSDIVDGIERAYNDFGVNFYNNVKIIADDYKSSETETEIRKNVRDGYTAFFTLGDYRAKRIYKVAEELNLTIGEDLSLIGLFDAPLCSLLTPHLSSISINEAEIGRLTALAIKEQWHGKTVMVEPELILRDSTIVKEK
jgi:GntR family transcriptional regulator, arabinose operon transcriptional repressor